MANHRIRPSLEERKFPATMTIDQAAIDHMETIIEMYGLESRSAAIRYALQVVARAAIQKAQGAA